MAQLYDPRTAMLPFALTARRCASRELAKEAGLLGCAGPNIRGVCPVEFGMAQAGKPGPQPVGNKRTSGQPTARSGRKFIVSISEELEIDCDEQGDDDDTPLSLQQR